MDLVIRMKEIAIIFCVKYLFYDEAENLVPAK